MLVDDKMQNLIKKSNVLRIRKTVYATLLGTIAFLWLASGITFEKYEWLSGLLLNISSGCISGLVIAVMFNHIKGRLLQEKSEVDYLDNCLNTYDKAILHAHRNLRETLENSDIKGFLGYLTYYVEKYQNISKALNEFTKENPDQRLFQNEVLIEFDNQLVQLQELHVLLGEKIKCSEDLTLYEVGKIINLLFSSYDTYSNFLLIHSRKHGEICYIDDILKKSSF